MKKNIFLCHGDIVLLRNTLKKIDDKEESIILKGLFSTGDKKIFELNNVNIFTLFDFVKNNINYNTKTYLSAEEINFFRKECFYNFITQTDRLSIKLVSNIDKLKMFDLFVSYFLDYFRKENITNVIFHTTPHLAFDFIFFHIANYLKIKKTIFFRTYYEDAILIADDYRKGSFFPICNSKNTYHNQLLEKKDSAWSKVGALHNKTSLQKNFLSGLLNLCIVLIKKTKYTFLNKQLQSFNVLHKKNNFLIFLHLHFLHLVKTLRLRKAYKKLSKKFDLNNEFVFFAMHNQPEKTTNPEGQEYDNQLNALKYLRKILDKKIKIFVKEHPKQLSPFTGDVRQLYSRSEEDYDLINQIENCDLLNIDIDTKTIIKNSKLNATITGTLAWESVLQNIPSVTFANTWHSGCKSTPVINGNLEIATKQINELIKKNKTEINDDVLNFSNEINDKIFFTTISDFEIQNSSTDQNILKKNLYSAILEAL
jgi:hypothetical protein